jgi:C4-dicarboxylate transporter, DctM subunit
MIATALALLAGLLLLSIPVAAALGLLGLVMAQLYAVLPLHRGLGQIAWNALNNEVLVAVPLFILLGELMLRSGVAERMYASMTRWLSWLPGGLMHANIGACALFAASSGSSVATAATVGTVALDQVDRYRYGERLFLGSLAAGGTLGILIPPSINLIVYGALTQTSIPQLYLAGFVPGVLLALLFMLTILFVCWLRPEQGGERLQATWTERIASLPDLLPPLFIFAMVIGSIYAGWATPTESAALGVAGAFVVAGWRGRLDLPAFRAAIEGTMRTAGMTMALILGSYFLNFVVAGIGLTRQVSGAIDMLGLTPFQTLMLVVGFYLVIGMFLESLSMMVATVPIIVPVVTGLGYDSVWFGIVIMLLVEVAMITPPIGVNLFVVHGLRRRGSLADVIIGVLPFVVTLLAMIALIIAFPDIALWLPRALAD